MGLSEPSKWNSSKRIIHNFVSRYRETNLSFVVITSISIVFGFNGLVDFQWEDYIFGGLVVVLLIGSLLYNYLNGRPFGIEVSCTPTHIVDEDREPDMESDDRDIALIQNGELVLHGNVRLSKFHEEFSICLDTSSEIEAELRTIPRKEQEYDLANNSLSCNDVSEYEFPLTIEIFPNRTVADGGRYHSFAIVDQDSNQKITEFDVLNVGV
jgi:hypothetical protein